MGVSMKLQAGDCVYYEGKYWFIANVNKDLDTSNLFNADGIKINAPNPSIELVCHSEFNKTVSSALNANVDQYVRQKSFNKNFILDCFLEEEFYLDDTIMHVSDETKEETGRIYFKVINTKTKESQWIELHDLIDRILMLDK